MPQLWGVQRLSFSADRFGVNAIGADAPGVAKELAPDSPALISFTSGSTGAPKAIQRSHRLLAAQNASVRELLATDDGSSVDLVAFPVFVLANLSFGNTCVLPSWNVRRHDRVDASDIVELVERHDIQRLLVPPVICETLAPRAGELRVAQILTGGGPVFPDVVQRIVAAAPGTDVIAVYGSTEAEPICHVSSRDISAADWHHMENGDGLLAGHPSPTVRLALLDSEIVVTGEHVNKGYLDPAHDAQSKIKRDGEIWHRTGDAGQLDDSGRLWLKGRHSGRAGSLYPFAIETAARMWPGVRRAGLVPGEGRALLAIEADGDLSQEAQWRERAAALGDVDVIVVSSIPLDRRHRSKVDYLALAKQLAHRLKA